MTAMDALGIGAIMNTYNILLNSLKGVSPKEYVLDKKEKITVPIRMLLPNNVTKDGNISLHNTYSYRTDKKEALVRISDIFSQMINGWVDVGKDPWIFYIQGNREITPVLMYMLMAGVPVEHAVYFVSQPLVRRFIALKKERGASEAYKILLNNKNKNQIILNSLNNEEEFQLNDLKNQLIPENVDEEYQEKVLRHFIEISNISEAFTKFSRATNVDTTRENSYLSTREREASLNELLYDGRIDRSLVQAIQNSEKSMIGSFFIGDFAIALTKSVLPFRFDARIDNFINKLSGKIETDNTEFNSLQEGYRRLSNSQTSNKATGTELLDAAFRDELVLALYQNAVRGFRLGVSDSYKGFGVSETVPVQYVDYLKKGVYLTKDKIYISASEIQRKYESLSNDFRNKEFPTIHEYTRFLIERAIVELTQPDSTDSQKENRAYINSFNLYKLFQDPALSFANVFYRNILKKDFSEELKEQFPVLSYFLTNSRMYPGYVILDFIGKNIDDITATSYHSQLKQLQDFTAVKNRMPNLSDSNIKLINYVFTMLPQIAFLQNGFSKNVSNLVNLVDLSEVNATIQDAISGFDFSEQSLLNFANGFIDGQTRKTTVPVRQYSLAPVKISQSELVPGAFTYRLPGGETIRSNYVPSKNFRNLFFTNEQYGDSKPYNYYDLVIKQDQTGGVYVVYPSTLDPTEAARSPYLKNSQTRAKYLPISIGFKEVGDGFIEGGQPTQSTTQVLASNDFTIADSLPPIEQNFKDGQGSRKMQPQFAGKSTMDIIISGDRTRTTRAKTDIDRMMKDYNLSKIEDLVGKVIRMTDKTGRQVYTRITKVTPFTQEYQDATWQKEGWVKSVTDIHVGNYPYAIEFEIVQPSTQAPVSTPAVVVQGNTPSIEEAKKRINEQLSQIEEILSNPRNAVVMDMSLLINDILKQNTPQIAGSKVIAEYLYGELYKRFNLPVPGSSKFGVMDLIIENQEGVAGETLVSEDLTGLDLDGTCFRA